MDLKFSIDYHSFLSKKQQLKKYTLLRALGKSAEPLKILDLTCGFGFDSLIMALQKHQVTALEREKSIYDLAHTALQDFQKQQPIHFEIILAEALEFLQKLSANEFDIIYYDPMFPPRNKTAAVKKPMQFLQNTVTPIKEGEAEQILNLALQKTKKRVIVKRHLHSPFIDNRKPDFCLKGKAVRFDVYLSVQHFIA